MAYPNFQNKHAHDALIAPEAVLASFGKGGIVVPRAVILTYKRGLLDRQDHGLRPASGYPAEWGSVWLTEGSGSQVAILGGFGIGAPVATVIVEELIACGAREFISIGEAGCLQPEYTFGDLVVCTGAVRDEGVSHHYAPSERLALPSEVLTNRLSEAIGKDGGALGSGLTWTIDAPYRETVAEARSYQAEGVVCVEMEAAALFTVGAHRHVDVAAAFAVSDHLLAEDRWTHAFGSPALGSGLARLLDAAIRALGGAG